MTSYNNRCQMKDDKHDLKWNDIKCRVVKRYGRFEEASCFHLQCQEDPDLA